MGQVHWSDAKGAFFDVGWTFDMPSRETPVGAAGVAHFVQDVMVACGEANPSGPDQVTVPDAYDYRPGGQVGSCRQNPHMATSDL